MMTLNLDTALIWMYLLLTCTKAMQLILHWIEVTKKKKKKNQRISYNSSLKAAVMMINLIAQQEQGVEQIPRREYQVLTDPLLEQYTKKYANQKEGKLFTSLGAAQESFFYEFTGLQQQQSNDNKINYTSRITWFLCHSIAQLATKQLSLPLGLTWCLYVVPWFLLSALALVHEKFHVMKWVIHVAIAVTIVDVYVVCCKYDLSFEEGIRKYKWLDLFAGNKQQVHPLIGTHVCPMYQRKIEFRPDKMDFDFVVAEHRNSMPTLHETKTLQQSLLQSWIQKTISLLLVVACSFVVLLLGRQQEEGHDELLLLLGPTCSLLWNLFAKVAPSATLFYSIRYTVDSVIATQWDHPWTL